MGREEMTAGLQMDEMLSRMSWGFRVVLEIEGEEQILFLGADVDSSLAISPGAIINSCEFGLWI